MDINRVKDYIRTGQLAQMAQWAKQNQVDDIEKLIDRAADELKRETRNEKSRVFKPAEN